MNDGGGRSQGRVRSQVGCRDVDVIIVSYNVKHRLAECLRSLPAACGSLSVHVVVVDNASADHSAALVATEFPEVRLIQNSENVGFARAVNQALALTDARYVLLLNPDTIVPRNAITRVTAIADAYPEAGIVAPLLRNPHTDIVQPSFRRFPTWRRAFEQHTAAKWILRWLPRERWQVIVNQPTTAGWLSGACMLIRRKALDIGCLDERFFMWCEDIDYCKRMIDAGWQLLQTSEVSVYHHEGQSVRQERPSVARLQQLTSELTYLRKTDSQRRLLTAAFKTVYLGTVLGRLCVATLKVAGYSAAGNRAKADRYWRRLRRDAMFIGRVGLAFLRV